MKKAKGTASSSTSVDVPLRGSMRTVKVNSGKNGGVPGIWPCRHAGNRFVFLNNADSGSKTQCGAGGLDHCTGSAEEGSVFRCTAEAGEWDLVCLFR